MNSGPDESEKKNTLSQIQKYRLMTYIDQNKERFRGLSTKGVLAECRAKFSKEFVVTRGNIITCLTALQIVVQREKRLVVGSMSSRVTELCQEVARLKDLVEAHEERLRKWHAAFVESQSKLRQMENDCKALTDLFLHKSGGK